MKLLLTAFDPFGNDTINSALEAIKLVKEKIEDVEIIKLEVPTVFYKSIEVVEEKIKEVKPDIVLSIGQAGGRVNIAVERVAININDARIADNEGNQPLDTPIFEDGQNAYFSTLPIKVMVDEMNKENIPASISNTAGTFVCNHLMYGVQYLIEKKYTNMKSGFIHVPYIPSQVIGKNVACMKLNDIVKGIEAAIVAISKN